MMGKNWQMLMTNGRDEQIIYPILERMLTPGEKFTQTIAHLLVYGDYHYGYPFYLASILVALPGRLIYGNVAGEQMQTELLILRQMISVLPMILSAGVLVYLQTRFRRFWISIILFLLILFIPGVVHNNLQWWHPDALTVLSVVLTFFCLDRDDFRFGKWFWLAAVACGMATAIKLVGLFFFLAIAAYLLVGWRKKHISFRRMVLVGLVFVLVMSAVIVLSNPFLFFRGQPETLLHIFQLKSAEIDQGYTQNDPYASQYQKGPQFWEWTLNAWYAPPLVLGFVVVSLLAAILIGKQRRLNWLILAWSLPQSIYLLYFLAPKPDHYWLPVMVPLFSALMTFPEYFVDKLHEKVISYRRILVWVGLFTSLLILAILLILSLRIDVNFWLKCLFFELNI